MLWQLFSVMLLFTAAVMIVVYTCLVGNSTEYVQQNVSRPSQLSQDLFWPLPQQYKLFNQFKVLDPAKFSFKIEQETCDILESAVARYEAVVCNWALSVNMCKSAFSLNTVSVRLTSPCERWPHLHMDEKYELHVNTEGYENVAVISSDSVWGILRGLETFSQLVTPASDLPGCLAVFSTDVLDYPRFPHRGLLIDSARHYLPVHTIYNMLDAMEMNKINVLHWHIVDDQSFPYQSYTFPSLSEKGAFREDLVYTQQNLTDVIEYARLRGIRVIPEFNTPGHSRSWGKGMKGLLTLCPDQESSVIDPTKERNHEFMSALLWEVRSVFPDHYIHIGGDEAHFNCWKNNSQISAFMGDRNLTSYEDLQALYVDRVLNTLSRFNASAIAWQESFQHIPQLANDTIVQIWAGNRQELLFEVTAKGYYAVSSEGWHLDNLSQKWQDLYAINPTEFLHREDQRARVLGGEACIWGELVDEYNVVQRTWPRASAVAERLWSDEGVSDASAAVDRLDTHVCRMRRRGVAAEPASGPGYCAH